MKYIIVLLLPILCFSQKETNYLELLDKNNIDPTLFIDKEVNTIITDSIRNLSYEQFYFNENFNYNFYILRETNYKFLNNSIDKYCINTSKDNRIENIDLFFTNPFTIDFYKQIIDLYGVPSVIKKIKSRKKIKTENDVYATIDSYEIEYQECEINENPTLILWNYKNKEILLYEDKESTSYYMNGKKVILSKYKLTFRNASAH
ncbi:hypothetical protein AWE51_10045 [Aquimarina aggregata]|uniref:Uncharacterized protein n=1 Tax=Aquimarina aggregata TaxID=1642818 RepID=A0A162ZR49_9FLAO|nr:hypothetical protein [Aquimarina aggregata]KZS39972.1 hypothetical protein AWE51_10045 [Aquimarina aggregata]